MNQVQPEKEFLNKMAMVKDGGVQRQNTFQLPTLGASFNVC